jgi:uncharacterized C2H2 Zn-finger protein
MKGYRCNRCGKDFSRKDVLKRHVRSVHEREGRTENNGAGGGGGGGGGSGGGGGGAFIDGGAGGGGGVNSEGNTSQSARHGLATVPEFSFLHPYTMMVSGPTSCGKSTFVTKLLQQALTSICPPPQRIVWLYKRWQPLYSTIQMSVRPRVEFIQGIPPNIDQDSFFDPRLRNLIIADDLMSTASKDHRITEIFYEGSHHRNLSVIQICQNLYYGKDPTQRRNCHYVVLFKNPNDRQSTMTFARQMNPQKSKEFMNIYESATAKPHGYLLVDFKQTTCETDRLRPNVLEPIKGADVPDESQYMFNDQAVHIEQSSSTPLLSEEGKKEPSTMASCDDCGVVFDNVHDLQTHVKTWCPEKRESGDLVKQRGLCTNRENDDEIRTQSSGSWLNEASVSPKKRKLDPDAEQSYFQTLRNEVGSLWEQELKESRKVYMDEGYSKDKAKAKAINERIKPIRKDLYETYAQLIDEWMMLSEMSAIHQRVMDKAAMLRTGEKLDWLDAARQAIKEYKPLINTYVMPDMSASESEEEEETEADQTQ